MFDKYIIKRKQREREIYNIFKFINKYVGGPIFLIILIILSALPYILYYIGLLYIYDFVSNLESNGNTKWDTFRTYAIIIIAPNGSVFVRLIFLVYLHKRMV